MKTIFITLFLLVSVGKALAQDSAEVMKRNGKTLIEYGEELLSPTEVVSVNENVDIYVVRSGDIGTSVIITVFRGIIWDKEKNQVLGMFPYKYEAQGDPGYKIDQPEWDIKETTIRVKDLNLELDTTINL